jgi:hypothetical protein
MSTINRMSPRAHAGRPMFPLNSKLILVAE